MPCVRPSTSRRARPRAENPCWLCALERDLPRARQWAEVYARRQHDGRASRVRRLSIGGEWPLESFSGGRGLPLAPRAAGGLIPGTKTAPHADFL